MVGIIILGINYAYSKHSVNYGTMGKEKDNNAYIKDVPHNIQVCNFGNSHGYYGFDYTKFKDKYICFNFSLPSQSMSYNYLILRNYKDYISDGAKVFICVSYSSFYGINETKSPDFIAKNKRYYHFLNKENIKEYDLVTDILVNGFPALISPNVEILLETTMGINKSENVWLTVIDEKNATKDGILRYESHVAKNVDVEGNRIVNKAEIDAVYNMIELCHQIGAQPILLTTPYLSEYTSAVRKEDSLFYSDFYGIINQIVKATGVNYFDYAFDERFINDYSLFMNTDHLNEKGAQRFTDIVMEENVQKIVEHDQ